MAQRFSIGNRLAPWRFILFFAVLAGAWALLVRLPNWSQGVLIGFDIAAVTFLASCVNMFGFGAKEMRRAAEENNANRVILLVLTLLLAVVVLAAILTELGRGDQLTPKLKALIAASLVSVWMFTNAVYTLHYSHLFYTADDGGKDAAGLVFPATDHPLFGDFVYFAYTLGVAVQTSDVCVTSPHIRKVVTAHCVVGFFFNLGVLALSINVLGGS